MDGNILGDLGQAHHLLEEHDAALPYLEQSIALTRESGVLYHTASILNQLGHTLTALNRSKKAASAYRKAVDILREANLDYLGVVGLSGLARLALAQGEADRALGHAKQVLAFLEAERPMPMQSEPVRLYLSCYQVLRANQDPQADRILETGHRELWKRVALIGDEGMKWSFLENVPWHRELLEAYGETLQKES